VAKNIFQRFQRFHFAIAKALSSFASLVISKVRFRKLSAAQIACVTYVFRSLGFAPFPRRKLKGLMSKSVNIGRKWTLVIPDKKRIEIKQIEDQALLKEIELFMTREIFKRLAELPFTRCASCLSNDNSLWFPSLNGNGFIHLCPDCYQNSRFPKIRCCANCVSFLVADLHPISFHCTLHEVIIQRPYERVCDKWEHFLL